MRCPRPFGTSLLFALCLLLVSPHFALSQDDAPARRGRKYKAPPETSHIEVMVTKKANGKPIMNAAVVFNPSLNGKDIGSLEVKTDPTGKATIDVIPTGSMVRVQIIANGYSTFAEDYLVTEPERQIFVAMLRPQEQISAYEDNSGKASARKAGVQEPPKPIKPVAPGATVTPKPAAPKLAAPKPSTDPAATPKP